MLTFFFCLELCTLLGELVLHLVKDVFMWKARFELEHENCIAGFSLFWELGSMGREEGNWHILRSHPVTLLLT